jgi:hypothetical protein
MSVSSGSPFAAATVAGHTQPNLPATDYFGRCGAFAAAAAGFSGMMFAAAGSSPGLAAFASCE